MSMSYSSDATRWPRGGLSEPATLGLAGALCGERLNGLRAPLPAPRGVTRDAKSGMEAAAGLFGSNKPRGTVLDTNPLSLVGVPDMSVVSTFIAQLFTEASCPPNGWSLNALLLLALLLL